MVGHVPFSYTMLSMIIKSYFFEVHIYSIWVKAAFDRTP
jgi:hypothetical protein